MAAGSMDMNLEADRTRSKIADRDDAADASRFFSRMGYAVLAIGAPVGVVVHPLALFIFFPIGVAMIVMAAALEAKPGFVERILRTFRFPAVLALVAGLAWATLSTLWTPYPVSALQHALKLALLIAATTMAIAAPRDNARATDLYLFPIGVVLLMAAMAAKGALRHSSRREGRWRPYGRGDRARRSAFSCARRTDCARTQRLCAAAC